MLYIGLNKLIVSSVTIVSAEEIGAATGVTKADSDRIKEESRISNKSKYILYVNMTWQARYALEYFKQKYVPNECFKRFVEWCNYYHAAGAGSAADSGEAPAVSVFEAVCRGCHRHLKRTGTDVSFSPPVCRDYETGIAYHTGCHPSDSIRDAVILK